MPFTTYLVFLILLILIIAFGIWFIIPAISIKRNLKAVIAAIDEIQTNISPDLDYIANNIMAPAHLKYLWDEYVDTLHPQKNKNKDAYGQDMPNRWRSTVLSETFFTQQALVDTPTRSEFFKHVPGILTGLGIIGTFSGLIIGLQGFKVADNPDIVRGSLEILLNGVREAFWVSAAAIFLAMLTTFIEKYFLTSLYKRVEELCYTIDRLFDTGAGEEYLARLVDASETSAQQVLDIKNSLVDELKGFFVTLSAQHISAIQKNNQKMATDIAQTLGNHLSDPLSHITQAVDRVCDNQKDGVGRLLTEVLANFNSRMESNFGEKTTEVNKVLQQTVHVMQQTLGALSTQIQGANQNYQKQQKELSENTMHVLHSLTEKIDVRLKGMERQLDEAVLRLRETAINTQEETNKSLKKALNDLGDHTVNVLDRIDKQSEKNNQDHIAQQQQLLEHVSYVISRLSSQTEALVSAVDISVKAMTSSASELREAVKVNLIQMNNGANTLYMAATEFSTAGQSVSGSLHILNQLNRDLTHAAANVYSSMDYNHNIVDDYQRTAKEFSQTINQLERITTTTRKEFGITETLVDQLNNVVKHLSESQKEADHYLAAISDVLAESHKQFAENLHHSLTTGNEQFQAELRASSEILMSAVDGLTQSVKSLSDLNSK
jgi:hypothetical protein